MLRSLTYMRVYWAEIREAYNDDGTYQKYEFLDKICSLILLVMAIVKVDVRRLHRTRDFGS